MGKPILYTACERNGSRLAITSQLQSGMGKVNIVEVAWT